MPLGSIRVAERRPLGSCLLAALIAGLLAGLTTGIFHLVATEPVIQRAIDIEGMLGAAAGEQEGVELVGRPAQRVGLIIGFLIYGTTWGLIFGVAYWALSGFVRERLLVWTGLGLAVMGYWMLGVLPQLKYPANPPGVGDPETIGYRQSLYFGFLALSVMGGVIAALLYNGVARLRRGWERPGRRIALVAASYLVYIVAISVSLPDNPDPMRMPRELVTQFRWLSVAGVSVFWLVLGVAFILLARRTVDNTLQPGRR